MKTRTFVLASALLAGCYLQLADGSLGRSEPGVITSVPGAVVVAIGGATQLDVSLLGPDGARATAQPAFTFASVDESVATVDAHGLVRGIAEGASVIEITDGHHGTRVVPVTVSMSVGVGGVVMTCRDPIVVVAVGQTITPAFAVTDATGAVVAGTSIALSIEDPTLARVDADGSITGLAAGSTYLLSGTLAGGCTLVVVQIAGGGGGAGLACDGSDYEEYCEISHYPLSFSRPGQSSPVRLWTYYSHIDEHCVWHTESIVEDDADGLSFHSPGVIEGFGGRVHATAPGVTRWDASWQGSVTGREYRCGTIRTSVGIDLAGDWSMRCPNGDHGSVSLDAQFTPVIRHAGEHGARTFFPTSLYRGHATICSMAATPMACDDVATASFRDITPLDGGQGTCASHGGCTTAGHLTHCGAMGSGGVIIDDADRFHVGDCTYTRGAGDTNCAPPDVGVCTGGPWCSGVMLEFCTATCSQRVQDRIFPCAPCTMDAIASCAAEARAYADMLCGR